MYFLLVFYPIVDKLFCPIIVGKKKTYKNGSNFPDMLFLKIMGIFTPVCA
jgi:hypothetical protein